MARYVLHVALLACAFALCADQAHAAYSALQCNSGQPVAGTTLYDESATGACQFTGIRYIFSTIICQFVSMINTIMGKLYCSIQAAAIPAITVALVVFVVIYGVQVVIGKAQLSAGEAMGRVIKMAIVVWLIDDNTFGVSAGISYMFNFFVSFISETTRWVVSVLDQASSVDLYNAGYSYNPGITSTFKFIDDWIYGALTGSLSNSNGKVLGFFIAMGFVMPTILIMAAYWWVSMLMMLIRTLIAFLMAVVAIAFLLGLSPIFLSFILFQSTFQFFDQWLRFMASFSIQVMVSFAILTLWIFSLSLFAPFFNELSTMIFPYQKVVRTSGSTYVPANTWGLCPMDVTANPIPSARCRNPNFNPIGPTGANDLGNQDYQDIIPPTKVPELNLFLFYLFYHMISLIIVSYGFASLQKNSGDIAKQLAGPSYVPLINASSLGQSSMERFKESHLQSEQFMSKSLFNAYGRRHEVGKTWYEQIKSGASSLVGGR